MSRTIPTASALLLTILIFTGCTRARFATSNDAKRLTERHKCVADVTCLQAQPRHYKTLCDEFHMLAMPPRVRWTVTFRVDRVTQGNVTTNTFRLIDARDRATPFLEGFYFQTNKSYRVGFDRISDGEVRGLEILTNNPILPTEP